MPERSAQCKWKQVDIKPVNCCAGSSRRGFPRNRRGEQAGKIDTNTPTQVADLDRTRIALNKIVITGSAFDHEIESDETGRSHTSNHYRGSLSHVGVITDPDSSAGPRTRYSRQGVSSETAEHAPLPSDRAVHGWAADDRLLDVDR